MARCVDGAAVDLVPLSIGVVNQRRVAVLSYDGTGLVTDAL